MAGRLWEVVGGADKGGVIVRSAQDVSSAQLTERLATGAVVREVVLVGTRLQYVKLTGTGPTTGWVSIKLPGGKDLLVSCRRIPQGGPPRAAPRVSPSQPERRRFPDGNLYTKEECIEFYGSESEWDGVGEPVDTEPPEPPPRPPVPTTRPLTSRVLPGGRNGHMQERRLVGHLGGRDRKTCSACRGSIDGEYALVEKQAFHWHCFTCTNCRKQLKGTYFPEEEDGKRLCEECIMQRMPLCTECSKPILTESMTAEGKVYHAECFRCDECYQQIFEKYFPEGSRKLCEQCVLEQLPKCTGCQKPIKGTIMTVEGKDYHQGCLKCATCRRSITGLYTLDKGRFKCEHCQMKLMAKCAACFKPLVGEYMTVQGKAYHSQCCRCQSCGWQIEKAGDVSTVGARGQLICNWCQDHGLPTCASCAKPINAQSLQAEGKAYHRECFRCEKCRAQIKGHYYPDENMRILCEPCYSDQCPKCTWCGQAIMDKYTTAEEKSYHVNCFACSSCGSPIQSEYFKLEEHFMCAGCYNGKPPRCVVCSSFVKGTFAVVDGKPHHGACFRCSICLEPIAGRYLSAGGRISCEDCRRGAGGPSKMVLQRLNDTTVSSPDQWEASRLPRLERELRDLLRNPPKERKKRLRALQLELHPDKQAPERRCHAQKLFLMVQAEWEATEAEEKGKKPARKDKATDRDKEDWRHPRWAWHVGA